MSDLNAVADSLAKSGIKPQFKRQLKDGTLVDADTNYLDLLNARTRIANTAQSIHGASQHDKTLWAIEMKNFANALFEHKRYREALEKYVESLTASNFGRSATDEEVTQQDEDSNIDNLIVPVLCNMAACCLQLQEWGKAKRFCEEALRLRPRCFKALIRYSKSLFYLGEYQLVIQKLNELKSLDDKLLDKEKDQIEDLMKQARQKLAMEKMADERQRKALMKAFRSNPPVQHCISGSSKVESRSIWRICLEYFINMLKLIFGWFAEKIKAT